MKTTILLCALATIASAVPTNHHEILQEQELPLEHLPVTVQRERKSPLHDHHAAGLSPEVGTADIHSLSKSGHMITPMEARSLGFKKPIIVKKKMGYHVYRDSDEEMAHADPHENCSKQIKVKLCDDEPGSLKSMGTCFTSERLNEDISDKEIGNSIKTAKEAVENLQRGFHKMDHNSAKLATVEDKELEDDLAVHQHIEAARKALEHVHRNFENLDTLKLQTSPQKTEDFQSKSSDEERLAQWKEAIDNIQKNFDIARNIEDAFKSDSEQTNLQSAHIDEESNLDSQHKSHPGSLNNADKDELIKQRDNSDVDMFTAPTDQKDIKIQLHSDSLKSEKISEKPLAEHETKTINTAKTTDHVPTMKNSETTQTSGGTVRTEGVIPEIHQEVIDHLHNERSKVASDIKFGNEDVESNTHDIQLLTGKNTISDTEDLSPLIKENSANDKQNLMKSAHIESFDQSTKHREHDMSMEASHVSKHQSHVEMKHSVDNKFENLNQKGELNMAKMSLTDEHPIDQSLKLKSEPKVEQHHKDDNMESTNVNHEFHERMTHEVPTPIQGNMKHIEPTLVKETGLNNGHTNINQHTLTRMIDNENMEQKLNEHSISDMRMTEDQKYHNFLMRWANENHQKVQESPLSLSEDLTNGQHFHDVYPSMRLSHDHNTEHQLSVNHEHEPLLTHWAHEKQQKPLQEAKSATEFHETMKLKQQNLQNQVTDDHNLRDLIMRLAQEKQQNEHLKSTHEFHNEHLHEVLPQNRFTNSLGNANDVAQLGPRMHEHLHIMKHAMASEMDSSMQPSMHMSMRDSNPTIEHSNLHRNHHHHAMARYGSGLPVSGASSGAVGLFPNANTGGCGIPLMLSCSPNVVSGTLAKAQPHPGTITAPAYRSGDDLMYYMKRDAKDTDELPTLKIQKTSIPFNHKPGLIFEKTQ